MSESNHGASASSSSRAAVPRKLVRTLRCTRADSALLGLNQVGDRPRHVDQLALDSLMFGQRRLLRLHYLLELGDSCLRLLQLPAKKRGATKRLGTAHLAGKLCWTRLLP